MDSLIEEEIKKNGHTNLITDSGFESGQQIFAIGDSHSIFFYNSMVVKEHWFGFAGLPITIYTLINNDFDLFLAGNFIGKGHELCNITVNDFVLFCYGSNDMQKNINLHAADRWKEEIEFLINKYVEKVLFYKVTFNIIPLIYSIFPSPRPDVVGHKETGSIEERRNYIVYANSILKILCNEKKIYFLDIYDFISDDYGLIKEEFTRDKIHLDPNNKLLRKVIDDAVLFLCKSNM
jgi:hypothetical protein